MIQRWRFQTILFLAILFFAGAFRFTYINVHFGRNTEGCGAFFGLLARNYFRYDLATTRGIPVMSMGRMQAPIYYANHPPATPMLIALVYAVTGYHGEYNHIPGDWGVRLPTVLFTLGCLVAIYWMMARRGSPRAGLFAAAIFASIPMTLMFGGLADVISPQLDFFALLTIAAYERFHDNLNWRTFLLLICAFAGAALTDWPGYFLLPVLGLHFVCTRPVRKWGWIAGFGAVGVAFFSAIYAYLTLGQPDWHWMIEQFTHRSMRTSGDSFQAYSFSEWFRHAVWELCIGRHTLIVTAMGLLNLPLAVWRRFSKPADRFAALVLSWGLLHVLIGRQGVYQHEWWWWPLTPGLCLGAGMLLDDLLSFLQQRVRFQTLTYNITAAVVLIAFATFNVWSVLQPIDPGPFNYSLADFGEVVRENTSPDAVAMVVESDASLAFWYYADRAVKRRVWDLQTFQRRQHDGTIDLSFDGFKPWDGPVHLIVVPKNYLSFLIPPFREYLDSHYPKRESGAFVIYDIVTPTTR